MAWSENSPDETKSVKQNAAPMLANTAFMKSTMENDHFWNTGGKEGRHKFAQMPKNETAGGPVLGANMDLAYYSKLKTATESVVAPQIEAYLKNAGTNIMQLLGMRSCCVFDGAGGATIKYKHNILSVTRTAAGCFSVLFEVAQPMPSVNYLVLGGAVRNAGAVNTNIYFQMDAATSLVNPTKGKKGFSFRTIADDRSRIDPLQCWFVVFGG